MSNEFNMQQSVGRLSTASFCEYLRSRGWRETTSPYKHRIVFLGEIHDEGEPYQLRLPSSPTVSRYRTLLRRAVYFLCEVEDREPREIIADILAHSAARKAVASQHRVRVVNSGTEPLQLRVASRETDHRLLPGDAVELSCAWNSDRPIEIEHMDGSLTIRD